MKKELFILILAVIGFAIFLASNSIKTEYARIQSRVEVTQAKVDALADELASTTKTVHAAIKSLTDRFLANEERETGLVNETSPVSEVPLISSTKTQVDSGISEPKQAVSVPVIIMHTTDNCGPCKAWVKNDSERWRNSGWDVVVLPPEEGHPAGYPWYEIIDRDGKQFQVDGPLNNNNFNAAKAGAK
jgi:hypothetical protein